MVGRSRAFTEVTRRARRGRGARLLAATGRASKPGAASAPFRVGPDSVLAGLLGLTELYLEKLAESLQLVATSEAAASGQWALIEPGLRWVRERNLPAAVWFALPDGSYWSVDAGKAAGNLSDRAYFPKVLAGEVVLGALVVSYSTGRNSAVVAVPIQRDGQVIGVLGASVFLEQFSALLGSRLALKPPELFYAFDAAPLLAVVWRADLIFQGPHQLGSPSLSRAVAQMLASEEGLARYEFEGRQRVVVHRRSARLGWWFVFGLVRGR